MGIVYTTIILILVIIAGILYKIGLNKGLEKGNRDFIEKLKSEKEQLKMEIEIAKREKEEILRNAEKEAENIVKSALIESKEEIQKMKDEFNRELKLEKEELKSMEERLIRREELIDRKEQNLEDLKLKLEKEKEETERIKQELESKLYEIANLTVEEAREKVLNEAKEKYELELAQKYKSLKEEYEEDAKRHAQWVVSIAVQRYASDVTSEITTSTISLPTDDMKGRIIGREGRNIRAFEKMTGCDLIIDDTPEVVVISGFNPLRREIARRTLEALVADGRIHPARIEEVYEKTKKELEDIIKEAGKEAVMRVGIKPLHPELVKLLGRLKFRTSYGQDVLEHSIEVATFAGLMASELGLNVELAKRAALLHDIGKAIDHEVEGSHAIVGGQIAKRYNEKMEVVNAIQYHHNEVDPMTPEAVIVGAADAVSAARPGARRETLENYIRRIEQLEEIAKSFRHVDKAYAIQAGREVRVIVQPDKIDDVLSDKLARDISAKIEETMEYPGVIKVTVIREKRSVAYAS